MKYRVDFGDGSLDLEKRGEGFWLNGQPVGYTIHEEKQEEMVIRIGDALFRIAIQEVSEDRQSVKARINGKPAELRVRSETELLMEKWGVGGSSGGSVKKVKAPMPGLIVKVSVAEGDSVSKGQVLLNFEAMKMENQLTAPGAGLISAIRVNPGDKVEKGQVLVEFA